MPESTIASDPFDCDPESLVPPPRAIAGFVQKLIDSSRDYAGPEKRADERRDLMLSVTAAPIDEEYRRCGEAFMAMTRDISTRGISLFHTRMVSQPLLALEMQSADGAKLRVAIRVRRCRPVGRFYEIAGEFITNLSR